MKGMLAQAFYTRHPQNVVSSGQDTPPSGKSSFLAEPDLHTVAPLIWLAELSDGTNVLHHCSSEHIFVMCTVYLICVIKVLLGQVSCLTIW